MKFEFIAYIFFSILVGLGVPAKLFQTGRRISAIIFLILSIFVFIFFGTRWFTNANVAGSYTGSWPPIINTCPDYLIYYKKEGKGTCVDLIGVNRSNGTLKPWTESHSATNPPAGNDYYFNHVYKPGMKKSQLKVLCESAQAAGLTWEGITNGESCSYESPQSVLGQNASSGAVDSQRSCPPT